MRGLEGAAARRSEAERSAQDDAPYAIDARVTYQCAVRTVDLAGNETSASAPVTVQCASAFVGFRFSIQPNTTFGTATLAYAVTPGALVRARIYTATGRLVREISCTAAASGQGSLASGGRDSAPRVLSRCRGALAGHRRGQRGVLRRERARTGAHRWVLAHAGGYASTSPKARPTAT